MLLSLLTKGWRWKNKQQSNLLHPSPQQWPSSKVQQQSTPPSSSASTTLLKPSMLSLTHAYSQLVSSALVITEAEMKMQPHDSSPGDVSIQSINTLPPKSMDCWTILSTTVSTELSAALTNIVISDDSTHKPLVPSHFSSWKTSLWSSIIMLGHLFSTVLYLP